MTIPDAPGASFHLYGPAHLGAVACTVALAAVMIVLARLRCERALRVMEIFLGGALLLEWPVNVLIAWRTEALYSGNVFPLHFCSVAAIIGAFALFTHKAELCELLYFWGLAGTLQGLVTPALTVDFPQLRFIVFFLLHGGVVAAAVHVVFGRGITPRRGAVLRAVGLLACYAAVVGALDALINALGGDANYGFLCYKPDSASLLDHLGPWPWYVGSIGLVAFVFFGALNLPFSLRRVAAASSRQHREP